MNLNIGEGNPCFCDSGISLQSVSGGAHANGYLGSVWLRVNGESVEYVRRKPAEGNPAGTPGAKVDVSRLSPDLPPPFDSQEEAQRAAGIWPQEAEPATVRVAPSALDEMAAQAASWRVGVDLARDGADAMAYMLRSARKPIDFKNHQWIGIAIDHATKWKTAGGLQNLLMAKHYLDKLIELEGKAS